MSARIPMLVICGPTASGKTAVGVRLSQLLGGEVISADSMQIYKELCISTARPTESEMGGVPHHLSGFLSPDEEFSVADFVRLASDCAKDIHSRGRLPVVVGGTGLYINALTDNISFDHISPDPALRKSLEEESQRMGNEYMHNKLCSLDPQAAQRIHPNNAVRVIRAIEMYMLSGKTGEENREESRRTPSPYKLCMIGLTCFDRSLLYDRINARVDDMLKNGLVEEISGVRRRYDAKTALNAIGYKELLPYFEGRCSLDDAVEDIKRETRRYAKRQLTWFRRDVRINWVDTSDCEQFDGIIANCMNIVAKSEIM